MGHGEGDREKEGNNTREPAPDSHPSPEGQVPRESMAFPGATGSAQVRTLEKCRKSSCSFRCLAYPCYLGPMLLDP
jgi:hypothetical protein